MLRYAEPVLILLLLSNECPRVHQHFSIWSSLLQHRLGLGLQFIKMPRSIISFLLFSLWSSPVTAQFGFFDHIFGNQQQQWQQRPSPGQSQHNVHADSGGFQMPFYHRQTYARTVTVPCSAYLCPDSLICVAHPAECPCPYVEDIKCTIPHPQDGSAAATVVCVRGAEGCSAVERLATAYSH